MYICSNQFFVIYFFTHCYLKNNYLNEITRKLLINVKKEKADSKTDSEIYSIQIFLNQLAWRGVAWRGVAWRGVAWRGVAWRGVAWRGLEWSKPI